MEQSQIELNLQALKTELVNNPATTHVLLRRPDGVLVDIPLGQATFTIKNNPRWVFEGVAVPQIELAVSRKQQAQDELPILPPKPSEEGVPAEKINKVDATQIKPAEPVKLKNKVSKSKVKKAKK